MTWTKIGAEFWDSPGMLAVDRDARLVHLEAMTWCNAHETDGHIPKHALRKITDSPDSAKAAAQLVAATVWAELGNGWQIVEFLKDQRSKAQLDEDRAEGARRTRRSRLHSQNDHSLCLPGRRECQTMARNAVTDGVTDGDPSVRPSDRPTAREGRKEGRGSRSATTSAGATASTARDGKDVPFPQVEPEEMLTIAELFELWIDSDGLIRFGLDESVSEAMSDDEYQELYARLIKVKRGISALGVAEVGAGTGCNEIKIGPLSDSARKTVWIELQRMVIE